MEVVQRSVTTSCLLADLVRHRCVLNRYILQQWVRLRVWILKKESIPELTTFRVTVKGVRSSLAVLCFVSEWYEHLR